MDFTRILLGLVFLSSFHYTMNATADWGYSGLKGPDNWAHLDETYRVCQDGREQSPVLLHSCAVINTTGLVTKFVPSQFSVVKDTNTISFMPYKKNKIFFRGVKYNLLKINLHAHSEHYIDEKAYPIEIQMLFATKEGEQLIIAIMIDKGDSNTSVDGLLSALSTGNNSTTPTVALDGLLPDSREYFLYKGSLTTPPCTENVTWIVFKNAISVSQESIQAFTRVYPNNFRTLQPFNERKFMKTE